MSLRSSRPSPALAVALIALFVALGGTGYAAATGSIDSREIRNGTVRGTDVRNRSLTKADFKAGQLPAGAPGPRGEAGQRGETGPRGESGASGATKVTSRLGPGLFCSGGSCSDLQTARCLPGERATGGGFLDVFGNAKFTRNQPSPTFGTPVGWTLAAQNTNTTGGQLSVDTFVVCAAP